ncbi:RING-H2 finger protein [Quillaja saponaria]|uniref:RING-H2 finger protein n=1 Tax=Quillaja saponaria TaxID=32244 RepID=A0AAD7PWX6_QUISA|nr:RING-H2 finger protein [Quillaja saponaria]
MISSGINLVMTVIGFVVSTMFIVFVCTRLVCARIHLNASRRSFLIASRSDLNMLERGLHGLDPVVVANFPTKKYGYEFAAEDAQCTVCLSEYHGEDILRILPYCGHSFHVTCIDIWLQQHSTCPVCRISLRELPKRKHLMRPLFCSAFRSHAGMEYHCMLSQNGVLSRTLDNRGIDPIEEDNFASEGERSEARENVAPPSDGDQIIKDTRNKRVEILSNP